jgi:hypothetical protein
MDRFHAEATARRDANQLQEQPGFGIPSRIINKNARSDESKRVARIAGQVVFPEPNDGPPLPPEPSRNFLVALPIPLNLASPEFRF